MRVARAEVVAGKLDHPWGLAFVDHGRMLVTEKPGRMRLVEADGKVGEPIAGLPDVDARGQGGLLDVELAPADLVTLTGATTAPVARR